jgi:hypothetical protein
MTRRAALPLLLLASAAWGCAARPDAGAPAAPAPSADEWMRLVRAEISGARALAVTAAVEGHWRLPGNAGFDAAIDRVAAVLDSAGFVDEARAATSDPLVYRIERRPMARPTWEPVDAALDVVGDTAPLLRFATNRNMLAIHSHATPAGGVEAEVVAVGRGRAEDFAGKDVRGKVVYGTASVGALFRAAVQERGASGVLAYTMPAYTRPETHVRSIQFGSVPYDSTRAGWGILLSYDAKRRLEAALAAGPARVRVRTASRIYRAEERTLVAEARGSERPAERFVFSAHVQEPGANDNASGVGALAEMARATAALARAGHRPRRTVTFVWGDEIRATARYLREDTARAAGVMWGMSLDMVGEDVARTGGTFLIEKMPDPSAVWTRGEDRHTEWGGEPMTEAEMRPHYLNDYVRGRCRAQAPETGWVVSTNPYEGGSDHTPFLEAGKPGVLLWHFTDVFYHTDADRIENVSPAELRNVGVCALTTALALASADGAAARATAAEVEAAALARLAAEAALGRAAVAAGANPGEQSRIVHAWRRWYEAALAAVPEMEVGGPSPATRAHAAAAAARVSAEGMRLAETFGAP